MPYKIVKEMTLDSMEEDAMFTIALLNADPNTRDLVALAQSGLELIDAERALERPIRQTILNVDAARILSNEYLDYACTDFGMDLDNAVRRDHKSTRWTAFFKTNISAFVRQSLVVQISQVFGWLQLTDPVLEAHRTDLTAKVNTANSALIDTNALGGKRDTLWQSRQKLADDLTALRDQLWETLSSRARQLGLPRTWPDVFFRTEKSAAKTGMAVSTTPATDAASPPPAPPSDTVA